MGEQRTCAWPPRPSGRWRKSDAPLRILTPADRAYLDWKRGRDALPAGRRQAMRMTVEELKALWDRMGETDDHYPAEGPNIEDVYYEMHERGEGEYCAI